ncbi:MAG: polysaccharide biosynthesis C-terminal domain-containing protein [Melioribacteraceae bacterium]|nr:polysaccharide biosynthesis C-terminal domain-containing protein [Melioribacteraceae bacterium]
MLNKLKQLTKDTAIYGISTIVGRFLGFLLVPFYTNVFAESAMGIYGNIYAYIAFFNILYIFGMDAAFMKYASLAKSSEKKSKFTTVYVFIFFTTIILTLFFYSASDSAASFMEVPLEFHYLVELTIWILLLDTLALVPFANLRLENRSLKFAFIKTVNIIINLSLNLILILIYDMGIEAVFYSNIAASGFSLLAVSGEIFKNVSFTFDVKTLKQMLKFGIPYLPASMAATIVQVIDRPILTKLTDNETVGLYTANYKLGIFMMLFVAMFQYAWQPFFLNNAKEKDAKDVFAKVLTMFVLAASLVWLFITLFIENFAAIEILNGKTIIGKSYLSGLSIVPIILFAYIFHGLYVNFSAGIYIEEKTKYMPLITGLGAVSNVAANLILIPYYGIMGAAVSTLISYIVMSAGIFIVANKYYPVEYEYYKIGKMFLLMIVFGSAYYYLKSVGHDYLSYKIGLFFFFPIALIGSNIIQITEIKKLVKLITRR